MTLRLPPERELAPYRPGFPPGRRWLVLAPHADDEVLGLGATIVLARRRGIEVAAVVVTDGARQGSAAEREAEAIAAAERLGIAPPELWRFADRTLAASMGPLESAIGEAVRRSAPDTVLVTSPVELHPDHRALAVAVQRSLRRLTRCGMRRRPPQWVVAYEVGTPIRANLLVAADEAWEIKRAALACYSSQLAFTPYDRVMEALGAFRCLTLPGCERAEAFHVLQTTGLVRRTARGWASLVGSPAALGPVHAGGGEP